MNQKKWNAVVIGLGKIGLLYDFDPARLHPASHIFALKENNKINIVAAIDQNPLRQTDIKRVDEAISFYQRLDDIDESLPIDFVSICNPPLFHLRTIEKVLKKWKPRVIFCEKPLVSNLDEVKSLRLMMRQYIDCQLVPNISRRWSYGLRKIAKEIEAKTLGELEKIHVRYTRGIYNTGAHLFDLLKMWTGEQINCVEVLKKVASSSEYEGEASYSFFFEQQSGVYGYAEAMDDRQYYLFEIDLFFTAGKIEIRNSGDDVFYYTTGEHHLFTGFAELKLYKHEANLLADSFMKNAVDELVNSLETKNKVLTCSMEDAIYPIYVADTLKKSYQTGRKERVLYNE